MVEQSFLVDWSRTKDFWKDWNIKFKVEEMNGASNFEMLFTSYSYNNIDECLTDSNTLKPEVEAGIFNDADCGLMWDNDGIISVANNVIWDLGTDIVPLKAIFLRKKSNKYVIGYSINQTSFDVTNRVIIDKDTVLWSFHNGGAV